MRTVGLMTEQSIQIPRIDDQVLSGYVYYPNRLIIVYASGSQDNAGLWNKHAETDSQNYDS
jgi:hypothetical protein